MFKLAQLAKLRRNKGDTDNSSADKDSSQDKKAHAGGALSGPPDPETLKADIIDAIRQIYDPEIPVNIYDLGLIYNIDVDDNYFVTIDMTLTAPACPVAEIMPGQVESVVKSVTGVSDAKVNLVWDPPWSQDSMSDEAKLQLGLL